MARNFYRFYLYFVFIALVIFAVVATSQLLSTLFELTPLRPADNAHPTQAVLIQAWVFAIIAWLISGALGGLHYWLIRRDQFSDPQAARDSAIRSFFLNMSEGIGVLLAVWLIGSVVLGAWAYGSSGDVSPALGVALPTLLMVLALEAERRRLPTQKTAALVFQRIHFFGVQFVFLLFVTSFFMTGFRSLVDMVFFNSRGLCFHNYCPSYQPVGLALVLFWFIACWLVYSWFTLSDVSHVVRSLMHELSLAFGLVWVIQGLFIAFEALLWPIFRLPLSFEDILGANASHDFVSPLFLGILVTSIYHLLLRDMLRRNLIERTALFLSEVTIATILLAGAFWWGCGALLYNLLQTLAPAPTTPASESWIFSLALLLSGLAYIPLDVLIRRRYARTPTSARGSRRSLILTLLGAGILTLAIGGAVALYAWGTALLGSPLDNWPQLAHSGLAATIIGVALIAIYVWPLRSEGLLARPSRPEQPPAPELPPNSQALEEILDELLADKITRSQAIARIQELYTPSTQIQS